MRLPLFFLALVACTGLYAQRPPAAYTAAGLMARASAKDTVYVLNFWATWCAPCIAELPEIEALHRRYAGRPVKVLLVSLDFKEDITIRVPAFIQRRRLTPEVVWLSETNANKFIPKIERRWEGSIPATLVLSPRTGERFFVEGATTEEELARAVDRFSLDPITDR